MTKGLSSAAAAALSKYLPEASGKEMMSRTGQREGAAGLVGRRRLMEEQVREKRREMIQTAEYGFNREKQTVDSLV